MSDTPATENVEPSAAPKTGGLIGLVRGFATEDRWLFVAGGICAAGAAYPILAVGIFTVMGLVETGSRLVQNPSASMLPQLVTLAPALIMFSAFALIAGFIGTIWTGFLSVVVVPVFYLFSRSLRLRASVTWLGAICGGIVGFVAALPVWLSRANGEGPDAEYLIILTLLGPCATTVLGQIGGAWGGRKAELRQPRPNVPDAGIGAAQEPLLRFQIRHLLWVTVWTALLLTAIRLAGIPFELIIPVLLVWLVYQAATLYGGWLVVRRIGPWWSGRRASRST